MLAPGGLNRRASSLRAEELAHLGLNEDLRDFRSTISYSSVDFYEAVKDGGMVRLYPSLFAAKAQRILDAVHVHLAYFRRRLDELQASPGGGNAAIPRRGRIAGLIDKEERKRAQKRQEGRDLSPHTRIMSRASSMVAYNEQALEADEAMMRKIGGLRCLLLTLQKRFAHLTLLVWPNEALGFDAEDGNLYTAVVRTACICLRLQAPKEVAALVAQCKEGRKKVEEVFEALARKVNKEGEPPVIGAGGRAEGVEAILQGLRFWERQRHSQPVIEPLLALSAEAEMLAESWPLEEQCLIEEMNKLEAALNANDALLADIYHSVQQVLTPALERALSTR